MAVDFRKRMAEDLKEMEDFDASFGELIGSAITTLETLPVVATALDTDSKTVRAHKNQKSKRAKTIILRAIRDLKLVVENAPEEVEESTEV